MKRKIADGNFKNLKSGFNIFFNMKKLKDMQNNISIPALEKGIINIKQYKLISNARSKKLKHFSLLKMFRAIFPIPFIRLG